MKVLHLPYNIASQISTTVRALRDIGVDARGLVKESCLTQDDRGIELFPTKRGSRYSVHRMLRKISIWCLVLDAIKWADVIHWRWGCVNSLAKWSARYIRFLNKPCLIDFCGSDIRIAENACEGNLFLRRAMEQQDNQRSPIKLLGRAESLARQAFFSRYGFECIIRKPELRLSIDKRYFPSPYWVMSPLMLSEFQPSYPPPGKRKPLVLHCPSKKKVIKGTTYVLEIVEKLKETHDFEFRLVHGVLHHKLLEMIHNCDIMLDQFLLGDYGIVATEGMAMGKPTVCWIRPEVVALLPGDLPIVNASLSNLADVLGDLIQDSRRRHEIGLRSREFVEKYHDAHRIARDLADIYRELLEKA